MPIHGSPWKGPLYGLWRSRRARTSDLSRISVVLRPASEGQNLQQGPWPTLVDVKSIARPVRAFRVAINQEALAEAPEETAPPQPPGIPTDSPTADSTALDLAVWETIRDSGDVEGFLHYLQRFPEGEFAEIARDRITALSQAPSQTLPVVASAVDADTAVELSFWESVRVSDNPDMYEAYLEKYPNGEFVPLAKVRLEELRQ